MTFSIVHQYNSSTVYARNVRGTSAAAHLLAYLHEAGFTDAVIQQD